jgi:hypothetical protein
MAEGEVDSPGRGEALSEQVLDRFQDAEHRRLVVERSASPDEPVSNVA